MTAPRELWGPFADKASQSWDGARSEQAAGRYGNAIALAYYACFQMVTAVLVRDEVPWDRRYEGYSHRFVVESFGHWVAGDSPSLISALRLLYDERLVAQYRRDQHTPAEASDIMELAARALDELRKRLEEPA